MGALPAFPQALAQHALLNLLVDQIADAAVELTRRQTAVLLFLGLNDDPQQFRDIAAAIGLQKAVLTRALATLRFHQFVTCRRSEACRRDVLVSIEAPGRDFLRSLR